jgi:hypothetical protein
MFDSNSRVRIGQIRDSPLAVGTIRFHRLVARHGLDRRPTDEIYVAVLRRSIADVSLRTFVQFLQVSVDSLVDSLYQSLTRPRKVHYDQFLLKNNSIQRERPDLCRLFYLIPQVGELAAENYEQRWPSSWARLRKRTAGRRRW